MVVALDWSMCKGTKLVLVKLMVRPLERANSLRRALRDVAAEGEAAATIRVLSTIEAS
jgi:hypothetical protein